VKPFLLLLSLLVGDERILTFPVIGPLGQ